MTTTKYQWVLVTDGVRDESVLYTDEDTILNDANIYKSMFPVSQVRIEQRRINDNGTFGRWENYLAQHSGRPYENAPDTAQNARSRK